MYSQGDSAGVVGQFFYPILKGLFGIISYILPVIIIFAGIAIILARHRQVKRVRLVLFISTIYFFLCFLHLLYFEHFNTGGFKDFIIDSYNKGMSSLGTGAVCAPFVFLIHALFGLAGAFIFFITVTIVGLLLLTNFSLKKTGIFIANLLNYRNLTKVFSKLRSRQINEDISEETIPAEKVVATPVDDERHKTKHEHLEARHEDYDAGSEIKIVDFQSDSDNDNNDNEKSDEPDKPGQEPVFHQETLPYMIPPVSLLNEPAAKKNAGTTEKAIKKNVKLLEETLNSFGVAAKVVQVSRGPIITRYELQPAPGVKVSRIVSLSDDIALNLAASSVRIEAPIPGKAAIGIEVPNKDTAPVLIREVLDTESFFQPSFQNRICLGKGYCWQ